MWILLIIFGSIALIEFVALVLTTRKPKVKDKWTDTLMEDEKIFRLMTNISDDF